MSLEKRRFIRFSLDIPITRITDDGEAFSSYIRQVSVGGCLSDWEDTLFEGDQFRMEIQLPNKNRLPLMCKAIYRFAGKGVGIKFSEITQFEQELLAQIISEHLENEGLPVLVDPFTQPPKFAEQQEEAVTHKEKLRKKRREVEAMVDEVIATGN